MEDGKSGISEIPDAGEKKAMIREAIEEFVKTEQAKCEPAYKTELLEERKRREQLERRVNELVEENRRHRHLVEETERNSQIRGELQRLGVSKIDLAFRAVKDDIIRAENGNLIARCEAGELALRDYLTQFVNQNPELLPARITGGSGVSAASKTPAVAGGSADLDKIRPGMSTEDAERIRQEIVRIASQTFRGA